MKYTFRSILESLPRKKNSNSSLWVKLLIRKISFVFTYFFINIGFSSNAVSILSIFVAIGSFACFCIPGSNIFTIFGVILINFWLVLDCVDGNIARCKKQKTTYGEFVDDIGGYYVVAFIYLAVSICSFQNGGLFLNNYWIIVMGGISCICDILARLINKDYEHFSSNREDYVKTDYTNESRKSLSFIRRRVGKELGISGAFMPFLIVTACFQAFDILICFYLLFNCFALLSTTVIYLYKAINYDRTSKKE